MNIDGGMHEFKEKNSNKIRKVVSKESSFEGNPVDKTRGILKYDECIPCG